MNSRCAGYTAATALANRSGPTHLAATEKAGIALTNELDTIGLLCPLPVLKARKRLQSMSAGEALRVVADDPAARIDFPHFCIEQGHELVSEADLPDGVLEFVIRKGG